MLRNYFTIAFRTLLRNKVYSTINICGLALGLAVAMLIILYAKDEVSYDQFHKNKAQIYQIVNQWRKPDGSIQSHDGNTGNLQGYKFKAAIPEVLDYVRLQSKTINIKFKEEIKSYEILQVDSTFFTIFSFPVIAGDSKTCLKNPDAIIISEEKAKTFFGTTDCINKTIDLIEENKSKPYTITAVTKRCPQNSSIKFDFLMPIQTDKSEYSNGENWFNFFLNTFVILSPGANQAAVEAKMKQVYESDAKDAIVMMADKYQVKEKAEFLLQPFLSMHLSKDFPPQNGLVDASKPMYSYILTGIAFFILGIACINFINLTIARSLKRAKEIGVRKVIGGNRSRLILQFLGESMLLTFIAFLLGIGIALLSLPFFNKVSNKALSFSFLFDWKLILGYLVLLGITGLLAGFYPALILSDYKPVDTLYSRFINPGKNYLQKSLVALQFALASCLIIATLTIYKQFKYLINKDLGYDDKHILDINNIWDQPKDKLVLFKNELLKNPNIIMAAPKNGGFWGTVARVNGETQLNFAYEVIDEDYFDVFKIPIKQGRAFSKDFPSDSIQSVMVNETFVKKAGWTNPINQTVDFWYRNHKYNVIGVVADYHYQPITQEIGPQLFTMKHDDNYGKISLKIKPGSEVQVLDFVSKKYKEFFPVIPFTYKYRDTENALAYEAENKWKQIMLFAAILTTFISCIGLFGLATLSAEKRTKEIGIRKVLGADVQVLVRMLTTHFLFLVGISFLFSFPVAFILSNKWLSNYPYRIGFNVGIYLFTAAITLMVALCTVGIQSIRAAIANPVISLRRE